MKQWYKNFPTMNSIFVWILSKARRKTGNENMLSSFNFKSIRALFYIQMHLHII